MDPLACAHSHAFWREGEGKPSCSPGLQARSPLRGLLSMWGGHMEVVPCGAQAGQAEAASVPVIGREGFRESGGIWALIPESPEAQEPVLPGCP